MKTLVTGATGFIGSAVVRHLLKAGYSVRALVRDKNNTPMLDGLDVEIVEGDIRSSGGVENAVHGCPIVIDLASQYRFLPFSEQKGGDIYETNVHGTKNLLEAAFKNEVKRFIYTSSIAAVGKRKDGSPSNEDTELSLESVAHYGRSKYLAEKEVLRFVEKGLPAVVLNPAIVLGERDYKPTPSGEIIVKFLNRRYPCFFDSVWSIADVDDVARAHVVAIEKGKVGQRYILCNKDHYTMKEVFKRLEKITGVKAPRLRLPYGILTAYVYVDEWISALFGKKPLIASEALLFCKNSTVFDNTRAVHELGYVSTPLEETLQKAVEWYREYGYVKTRC